MHESWRNDRRNAAAAAVIKRTLSSNTDEMARKMEFLMISRLLGETQFSGLRRLIKTRDRKRCRPEIVRISSNWRELGGSK